LGIIARQHDRLHANAFKFGDHLSSGRTHLICQRNHRDHIARAAHCGHSFAFTFQTLDDLDNVGVQYHSLCLHRCGAADFDHDPLKGGTDATTGQPLEIGWLDQRQPARARRHRHRFSERVFAARFGAARETQYLLLRPCAKPDDIGDGGLAHRERAGFIEGDGFNHRKPF